MTAIEPVTLEMDLDSIEDVGHWKAVGRKLSGATTAVNWTLGDWFALGADMYAVELVEQIVTEIDLELDSLRRLANVAKMFPPHLRRTEVSFSVHRTLAARALTDEARFTLLSRAATQGWTVARTKVEIESVLANLAATSRSAAMIGPEGQDLTYPNSERPRLPAGQTLLTESGREEPDQLVLMVEKEELDAAQAALAEAEARQAAEETARQAAEARAREAIEQARRAEDEAARYRATVEAMEQAPPAPTRVAPVPDNVARVVIEFRAPCSDAAHAAATRERIVATVDKLAKALEPKVEDVAGVPRAVVQGFVL